MNLFLWTDDMHAGILPVLESLKHMGFDGVELPLLDLNVNKWTEWARHLDDLGLERTAVTVCSDDANPISEDAAIRAKGLENGKLAVECCQAMGASVLVGPLHSGLGVFSGKGPTEEEWRWGVENVRKVSEHAAGCGVTLGLEFLNRFEAYLLTCAADTVRFIREVDHPNCRMMYDTFHAHIEEKDVAKAIRSCAEYLVLVHTSENDRSTPGTGGVNWDATFDTLREMNYDGWLTIEAFSQALEDLVAATKIWRRMFESEEQLARDGLAFLKQEVGKRW
jgi:D-psicose/D-tagatose/L-ribulose 3-epimerase